MSDGESLKTLDSWLWHALTTEQSHFAERHRSAVRYLPDVSVFAAINEKEATALGGDAWDDLAALVGPGATTVLFRPVIEPPPSWKVPWQTSAHQMILKSGAALVPPPADGKPSATIELAGLGLRQLGRDDVEAIRDLARRCKPGPFVARTAELGEFFGVHDGDRLVAMAGERSRLPGWTEISAVCTDDAYRGRGVAAGLVSVVGAKILAEGRRAVLHVAADNDTARNLYLRLGFELRRSVTVAQLTTPS